MATANSEAVPESKFKKAFKESVAAAFSGIWVQSYEHEDALRDGGCV